MDNLQNQVNARVEAFVAEITELARAAAYQALSGALDHGQVVGGRSATTILRTRKGGKRTGDEIAQMADAFLAYVTANPGQRMEHIAREARPGDPRADAAGQEAARGSQSFASKGRSAPRNIILPIAVEAPWAPARARASR